MPVSYKVLTPPTAAQEPITIEEIHGYLNIDFDDKNALLARLMGDARRYAEKFLRRSLATQTIQAIMEFDQVAAGDISGPVDVGYDTWRLAERPDIPLFGNALIRLQPPMGPVQSLTTVEYQLTRMDQPEWTTLITPDQSGNDTYRLDTWADPNELNIFTILAATRFRLTYVAGYSTLDTSAQFDYRQVLLEMIAWWYDHREGETLPDGIMQKLCANRVFML